MMTTVSRDLWPWRPKFLRKDGGQQARTSGPTQEVNSPDDYCTNCEVLLIATDGMIAAATMHEALLMLQPRCFSFDSISHMHGSADYLVNHRCWAEACLGAPKPCGSNKTMVPHSICPGQLSSIWNCAQSVQITLSKPDHLPIEPCSLHLRHRLLRAITTSWNATPCCLAASSIDRRSNHRPHLLGDASGEVCIVRAQEDTG